MRPADLALIVASVGLALLAVEGLLRAAEAGPWAPFPGLVDVPVMADPHPRLGWTNRPGSYRYTRADGHEVHVRVDAEGSRHTPVASTGGRLTRLMGGSYVFGFGLDDDATLASVLARARPDLRVVNHGVPGYGTLQCTLLYEGLPESGAIVVYGLTDLHDGRNAGALAWLRALERSGQAHAWTAVPFARWNGTSLTRFPPRAYQHWQWSERVAVVDLVERAWVALVDRVRPTRPETTMQLVLDWRDLVEERGGRFVVALLDAPLREAYYRRRLGEERVELVDLRDPRFPDLAALDDGHPDASVHASWGRRLAEAL